MVSTCCLLKMGKKCCATAKKGVGAGTEKGGKMAVERQLEGIREFRDKILENCAAGRALEWIYYYVVSPPAVFLLQHSGRLQQFLDRKVRPFLAEKCQDWVRNAGEVV